MDSSDLALKYHFSSLPLAAAQKDGNALVCYFPMPYGDGALITVENQGPEECGAVYYYVDYEEWESVGTNHPTATMGDLTSSVGNVGTSHQRATRDHVFRNHRRQRMVRAAGRLCVATLF